MSHTFSVTFYFQQGHMTKLTHIKPRLLLCVSICLSVTLKDQFNTEWVLQLHLYGCDCIKWLPTLVFILWTLCVLVGRWCYWKCVIIADWQLCNIVASPCVSWVYWMKPSWAAGGNDIILHRYERNLSVYNNLARMATVAEIINANASKVTEKGKNEC